MQIKNYTPHDITIVNNTGDIIKTIPSEGIARLKTVTLEHDVIEGISITKTVFGSVTGLPDYSEGIYYIVSQLVKRYVNRGDLLVPTETVRNSKNQIIGCRSLGI